jgi:hypothetical protein
MPEKEVAQLCADLGIMTTSIETLVPRGTRVVCRTGDGSAVLRRKLSGKLIEGTVVRTPRSIRGSW